MESESQNSRDARVERLWRKLDTRGEGQLDLNGLKKGLKEMDHPLKNADVLLKDVLKAVDTSGDGRIQYDEFRFFVEQTEKELWILFKSIDRDHNGKLDKNELQAAFKRAGLAVPISKLDQFFSEIDTDRDGVISFDEWRNFLLFIPVNTPGLKAILSYYTSTVTVNPEGDVAIHGDTVEGLGTRPQFPTSLFGAILSIASPQRHSKTSNDSFAPKYDSARPVRQAGVMEVDPSILPWPSEWESIDLPASSPRPPPAWRNMECWRSVLTDMLPHPGYFLAGGIAGVVSRTATAPLDRLKVYLIAQTGVAQEAVAAATSGAPVEAAKRASRPLIDATKALWRAGGMRSMFAGNGLNVLKVMPESAIKFGSYEGSKRALAKLEGHGDAQKIGPWSKFLAGGMGGTISQLFVYPIDTLKFRMQCETVEGGLHGNRLIAATAQKLWNIGGIRAYYRGLPMGLVGMFPYAAIDLGTFEYLKRAISARNARIRGCHEEDATPGSFMTAGIGAFSGALGASLVYPLNLLRTRLQAQGTVLHPPTYTGIWDVTQTTLSQEGIRGLFKGITPNLLKVVPAVSITYVVYENSKKALDLR
ncbi:MAG: hypothetical protein M1827_002409 [Pycnora praestabilis]|nr:MAG: hypothetical protein M1827_002409 [Pycnora praestabilis]